MVTAVVSKFTNLPELEEFLTSITEGELVDRTVLLEFTTDREAYYFYKEVVKFDSPWQKYYKQKDNSEVVTIDYLIAPNNIKVYPKILEAAEEKNKDGFMFGQAEA